MVRRGYLFLICIDENKGIYRYHNILGEYLKQRFSGLPSDEQNDILHRAAAVFEAQHNFDEAVPLLLLAADYDRAMEDLAQMGSDLAVGEYLCRIPEERLARNLDLATRRLIYHADCGDFSAFRSLCDRMLDKWADSPVRPYLTYARDIFGTHRRASILPPEVPVPLIDEYHLRPETAALIFLGCSSLM